MKAKNMKWAVLPFIVALSLTACGQQDSNATAEPEFVPLAQDEATDIPEQDVPETQDATESVYELNTADMEATSTFVHVGDKILTQHGVNVTSYEAFGFDGEEEARAVLEPQLAELNALDHYEHTVEYGETHMTEEYFADYEAMDPADVVKLPGMDALDTTEDADYYSLAQTVDELESAGYTKVQ